MQPSTVLGGSETTLPTEDGDRSITYEFQKGRTSDIRVETFKFDYTVEMVTPDVESTDDPTAAGKRTGGY